MIWLYWIDDIDQIMHELSSPILSRYLDADFSQNLMTKQREIDKSLVEFLEKAETTHRQSMASKTSFLARTRVTLKLTHVRKKAIRTLRRILSPTGRKLEDSSKQGIEFKKQALKRVLAKAKQIAHSSEAELIIVDLPSYARTGENNAGLRAMAASLDVVYVDPIELFRDLNGNPRVDYFAQEDVGKHYSADGYEAVARAIFQAINNLEKQY